MRRSIGQPRSPVGWPAAADPVAQPSSEEDLCFVPSQTKSTMPTMGTVPRFTGVAAQKQALQARSSDGGWARDARGQSVRFRSGSGD
jgi:hypothetical protein